MKKLISIAIIILLSMPLMSQQNTKLEAALQIHHDATTVEEVLKSAQALAKISDANPKDWLSAYWTSFVYSQAGNAGTEKLKYFELALTYYERAEKGMEKLNDDQKSSLMALKALIAGLIQIPYFMKGNQEKGMEYVQIQVDAMNQGLEFKADNPLILVLMGTNQIGAGVRNKPQRDTRKIATGKILLLHAKSLYKDMKKTTMLTPDRWNEGWIDVWLARL